MIEKINIVHEKIWGTTQLIFCKNNVEIHRIDIKKGGFCSKHKHEKKFNLFYVESGDLSVTIFEDDDTKLNELTHGMSLIISPGQIHMFEATSDCVAYETYWIELDVDDIIRYNVGGINI